MRIAGLLIAGLVLSCHGEVDSHALKSFWRANDDKTVRRLPVGIAPENVFWYFDTRDFSDGLKTFDRLVDEGLSKSTYNCITLTLRCNPELGDAETIAAAKRCIDKAHVEGVKVYMDTDPRIARREFFAKWPEDRQGIAAVTLAEPKDGTAAFVSVFKPSQDHMSWGSTDAYRPIEGRVMAAWAVKRRADGEFDFATRRSVETKAETSVRRWREAGGDGFGHTDFSEVTVKGSATGLSADETLVVVTVADYLSIDVFSPHLIPFCRDLLVKYREVGADGGMRDEWGFIAEHEPDWKHFFFSPHFAAAYAKVSGRDMLADLPLMAYGRKGDAARSAAVGAYMKLTLTRNAEIERAFYDADKEIFGPDVYVCKHATWTTGMGPSEAFHNGLDWWQAKRDWAQGDEQTPIFVLNGMAKKFGGPVWLNEGYTQTAEHNVFRVWTYAMCGGRQVFHPIFGSTAYDKMPWTERRVRTSTDLLAEENVTAQARVRLTGLITRAQVDSPVAFVFGHESFVDWTDPDFCDCGRQQIASLMAKGWWVDAFPASEFALGTFSVDGDGWIRVGQQRYAALATWKLRPGERAELAKVTKGRNVRTRIFDGGDTAEICSYLEAQKSVRQPIVRANTAAGPFYPEPDGVLRLIDGTAVRIRADWDHPKGLPIDETIESNGVKVEIAAEGLAAVRAEDGEIVALAAGGLRRVKGPGIALVLDRPEDVVLLKIDGEWHGIWQTAKVESPMPEKFRVLTPHWMRLLVPGNPDGGVVFKGVQIHNVMDLVEEPGGRHAFRRAGAAVHEHLSAMGRERNANNTGVELRFVLKGDAATIRLGGKTDDAVSQIFIHYGEVLGDWPNGMRTVVGKDAEITIPRVSSVRRSGDRFDPSVVRLVLPYGDLGIYDVKGGVEPPSEHLLPKSTYLAYGSSITHGGNAYTIEECYASLVGEGLGADVRNLGFAGCACMEREMADFISEQKFDYATLEMGVNVVGSMSEDEYERRVRYFVDKVAGSHPKATVLAIDIFGWTTGKVIDEKVSRYRAILKRVVNELGYPNVSYVNGLDILPNDTEISPGAGVHPTPKGHRIIAERLLARFQSQRRAEPVKIVFDTDMVEDYDDVGALAALHALADEERCEILATVTCMRGNSSVAAVEVINAFYGRADIPVGCAKEIGVEGPTPCFTVMHGRFTIEESGRNTWHADAAAAGGVLGSASSGGYSGREIGRMLDDLIAREPKRAWGK